MMHKALTLHPFDSGSSDILSTLFDDLRNKVFINTHRIKYNKLWFSSLYQAVLQNTTRDFVSQNNLCETKSTTSSVDK